MGALARAYVRDDIDFTGSARRVLAIAEAMVGDDRRTAAIRSARAWRLWRHQHRSNQREHPHHYDVSDAFYRMWLDPRMVYSCAYFQRDDDTLDDAQAQKLDHICRKLRLAPGETLPRHRLRLGRPASSAPPSTTASSATGITLSQNQFDHVAARRSRRAASKAACKVELARLPRPARG